MQWKDKQYWYFITRQNMGQTMSLTPRRPINMSDDEPLCERICVAPTAAHCMSAIDLDYIGDTIYVYRTRRQVKARVPYSVYDSHITQEHWLHTKTRFTLVETLNISSKRTWGSLSWEPKGQLKDLMAIKSWCKRRRPQLAVKKHANKLWRSPRALSVKTAKDKTK